MEDKENCVSQYLLTPECIQPGKTAPVKSKQLVGGNKASFFVLGDICLLCISQFGIYCNIVLFFTQVLHYGNSNAASNTNSLYGSMNIFSFVGAFLADSYLGRLWTSGLFQVLNVMAMILLSSCTSLLTSDQQLSQSASPILIKFLYTSLYLVAAANGALQPPLISLGADQFDNDEDKSSYFSRYIVVYNVGFSCATTGIVYAVSRNGWAFGFWLSTGIATMGLILYMTGFPSYRQYMPRGNPFSRSLQVLVATIRKRDVNTPVDNLTVLYRDCDKDEGTTPPLTDNFRCLNKAAVMREDDLIEGIPNPWKLCTVTQVEEVKSMCRIIPVWVSTIFFFMAIAQTSTLFVEQGAAMNTQFGGFTMEPANMNVFSILTVLIFPIIYYKCIRPCMGRGLSPLERIGVGYLSCCAAILVAAVVETRRLAGANLGVDMSILWLCPQYILIGAAQFLGGAGQMEFYYNEAPPSMRSLASSLWPGSLALANYVSSLLVTLINAVTTRGGRRGWIPQDLDEGHLNYFYLVIVAMIIVNFLFFLWCGARFQRVQLAHTRLVG